MKRILPQSLIFALAVLFIGGDTIAQTKYRSKRSPNTNHARLGVFTQTVDDDLVDAFKLKVAYGVIVNSVVDDSPAEKAGIEEDDIIIALNGDRITDEDELIAKVSAGKAGDEVTVKIMRDGKELNLKATLDERDDNDNDNMRMFRSDNAPKAPRAPQTPNAPNRMNTSMSLQGYIGVSLFELNDQLSDYFGVTGKGGVVVTEVEKDSPASKAGLKAGDVIISADGDEIFDSGDLQSVIRDKKDGEKAELSITRNKNKMIISVTVEEREYESTWGNMNNFSIPDMGNFNFNMPAMRGLHRGNNDDGSWSFDSDEYQQSMKKLQAELEELRARLQALEKK
ncbi:MAG: PDZ domain-containing protein [candidate division Zixibacteria bacterium]|nr:PDZ domain-containing protein [candidate division Zixibacteria bacterium]